MTKVFVYGTLRNGCGNHPLLEDSPYLGPGTLGGASLYFDGLPKVVMSPEGGDVFGEVYEVSDRVLSRLDRLEGHPHYWCREEQPISVNGNEPEPVAVYLWKPPLSGARHVPSGDYTLV